MTFRNVCHLPRMGLADASRVFGLTPRALRFYEDQGLVEAHRDRLNHRYYDTIACRRLEWIARLRRVGLTLIEIEDVLAAEDMSGGGYEAALPMINRRREALLEDLATADQVLAEVASLASAGKPRRIGRAR